AGPHRQTYSNLSLSRNGSREQHIGQISASDQQDHSNQRHQKRDEGSKADVVSIAKVCCVLERDGDGLVQPRTSLRRLELQRQNSHLGPPSAKCCSGRDAPQKLNLIAGWAVKPILARQ